MITVAQFLDLSKNAKVNWSKARMEFPSVRQMLANIVPVGERTSEYSGMSSVQTARRRNDGDDAYKGTLKQKYSKNFTQAEIALQYDVTYQMRKFDKYEEIMRGMREMGRAAERRMEQDLAALLSYAWDSSYTNLDGETVTTTAPDGNPLIYAAHTAKGSSTTFSNQLATTNSPIDTDVLEALAELFNGFIDEGDGRLAPVMPDTIITGRHAPTVHTVRRILNSTNLAGSTDNDANTFKNEYKHLIVPFIDLTAGTEARSSSKVRFCFLAALGNKDTNGFRMEVSEDVNLVAPEQVLESSAWQFLTRALYDYGTTSAAFIAGTKGDASSA